MQEEQQNMMETEKVSEVSPTAETVQCLSIKIQFRCKMV